MDEILRVLHITTKMSYGGVQQFLMNYYRKIDKNKIQFDFIVQTKEKGIFDDEIIKNGGRIFNLTSFSTNRIKFQKELQSIFKKYPEYQIVHVHQNFSNIIPLRVARKMGIPVRISHSHNNYKTTNNYRKLLRSIFKLFIPFYATNLWACSIPSAEWLYGKRQVRRKNYLVINNAIETDSFNFNYEKRLDLRSILGLGDKFVLICVGTLNSRKNQERTINIFTELNSVNRNTVLLLLGDGENKNQLQSQAKENGVADSVIFVGAVSNVNEYYFAADCFITNSIAEGLPFVIIEAQKTGLPCIVSEAIPEEAKVIENFYRLNNNFINTWVDTILEISKKHCLENVIERKNIDIVDYDISKKAIWLENIYKTEYTKRYTLKLNHSN